MKVNSKAFGLIEVDDRQKITIPEGLYGFEDYKEYVLMDAEHQPFFWLQSLTEKDIAFILINPFIFRPDYELNITNEEIEDIGITSPEKALIFAIVTIPPDGSAMTANLQGPLIINRDNMTGKQGILADVRWNTRHDIVAELNNAGKP
ncbi:MAG: flagellar assembly protein FliW [Treponema sp.]|jgi:flagellar assembly factor FliW|nr:flagellar assembly protein FliW [Treponema sp.]